MRTGDELVAAFLAERDVACPGCGYNLRGVSAGRCPECARELALMVEQPGMTPPVKLVTAVVLCMFAISCWSMIAYFMLLRGGGFGAQTWAYGEIAKSFLIMSSQVVLLAWFAAFRRREGVRGRFVRLGLWCVLWSLGLSLAGTMVVRILM